MPKPVRVLFIVHAMSWSDKGQVAKEPITQLLADGDFDKVIEVVPSRPDILASRYLTHTGQVIEHEGISPSPFFRDVMFGKRPLFPPADEVTLVGGVLNPAGGGCLNVAFDCLIGYLGRRRKSSTIFLPIGATYKAGPDGAWSKLSEIEQVAKDLLWKMVVAGLSLEITFGETKLAGRLGQGPKIRLVIDART